MSTAEVALKYLPLEGPIDQDMKRRLTEVFGQDDADTLAASLPIAILPRISEALPEELY